IKKIAQKIASGRSPLFSEAHVVMALDMIESQGYIGRKMMSEKLGLGEGATRTLIRHLVREELLKISKSGNHLSRKGSKLHSSLRAIMSRTVEIPPSSLTVGPVNMAVLVRNASSVIKDGLEQRDTAIKVGAKGATTLIYRNGKLMMPGITENGFRDIPLISRIILMKFEPMENDVVIIGSAEDKRSAELGANMVAIQILEHM
ncbi:MAG: DUF4443 domain-containing protein, partial [Candidatus Bathyarchaeota archaeon]